MANPWLPGAWIGPFGCGGWARPELTALKSNRFLGWATITHPFHPLRGQRFKVLSSKTFNERDILSLKTSIQGTGSLAIPRAWTDRADPSPVDALSTLLSLPHLLKLVDLVNTLASVSTVANKEKG